MLLRRPLLLLALALTVAGCNNELLGPGTPRCDTGSNSMVLSVQALPETEYVPCINGLFTGWDYEDLVAETGRSVFWLDSDRMGLRFLEVALEAECNTGGAQQVTTDEQGVPLLMEVDEQLEVRVTIVPEGSSAETIAYGSQVLAGFRAVEEMEGRTLVVEVDASNAPTATRTDRALAAGSFVVELSVRDSEEETMTVIVPDTGETRSDLRVEQAIEVVEDNVDPPSYRGKWFYVFDNGCVTYTFNAEGPGVETIESDVQAALGLFEAEILRQAARDAGYDVP